MMTWWAWANQLKGLRSRAGLPSEGEIPPVDRALPTGHPAEPAPGSQRTGCAPTPCDKCLVFYRLLLWCLTVSSVNRMTKT